MNGRGRFLKARAATVASLVALSVALAGSGCGLENALVGGACKPGFTACDGRCVDLAADPSHCGACATACAAGVACAAGTCGGRLDVDPRLDASADGAFDATSDADATSALPDASVPDTSVPDANADACPPPPFDTAAHCGACGRSCSGTASQCVPENGTFVCKPPCPAPLEMCNGVCVDTRTDPLNCGYCNKVCPSMICVSSTCRGTHPGHDVVIGHDYSGAFGGSSQVKVLTNAVFLPPGDPVRILSFEKWSDPTTVARVKAFVAAAAFGRTVRYTVTSNVADVRNPLTLAANDVVLLYDQGAMTASEATATGTSWATALLTFAREGGTVVALDGAHGLGEMPALVRAAGLLAVTSHAPLASASHVAVAEPGDQVGLAVPSPYAVTDRSVTLRSSDPNGGDVSYVVRNGAAGDGDPVVVHKLVPGL